MCNFAHGDAPCLFANQFCRICMELYSLSHPAFGRCTRVPRQVHEIEINGNKYPRVPLVSNPGKGECGKLCQTNHSCRTTTDAELKSNHFSHTSPSSCEPPVSLNILRSARTIKDGVMCPRFSLPLSTTDRANNPNGRQPCGLFYRLF